MPEDRVTISADASQYFDVLSRAGVAADRLGASGTRVGEGFLRGERAIRVATGNIAAGLLSTSNAATQTLIVLQSLERVFKIGVLPTIGIAAGVAAFEVFHKQIEKTRDLYKDFYEELKKPVGGESGPSEFSKEIDTIDDKLKKLKQDHESFLNRLARFFSRGTPGGLGRDTAFGGPAFRPPRAADPNASLNQAQAAADKRVADLTDKEGKRLADAIARLADKINNTITNTLKGPRDLLADIGSGRFMRDFQNNQQRDIEVRRGQEIAAEIQRAIELGIPMDDVLRAEAEALGLVGGAKGFSIRDLSTLDFSNMNELSKYDFSGLSPLSGMQIIIQ